MLFLLSPAKSLDYDSPIAPELPTSEPIFTAQSRLVIAQLRQKSAAELCSLMSISAKLAELNVQRHRAWSETPPPEQARQAALAFNGDVYEGLQAASLSAQDWAWAQEHLLILSGLYGALRPLDLLQPYRLEMGTRLPVPLAEKADAPVAENLYQFWAEPLAQYLNTRLSAHQTPIIVNLASNEYFKAVDTRRVSARVIECVFQDEKAGQYKIISFLAKRARGLMARYAIETRVQRPEDLRGFDREGYVFDDALSSADKLVFRRREADRPRAA